jgi:hypothetical protein
MLAAVQGPFFAAVTRRLVLQPTLRGLVACLAVLVTQLVAACPAHAADAAIEGAAKALQKKAVEEDFLNLDYASAVKKLQQAIQKCDGDKCTSNTKGSLYRDLGAMQILSGNEGDGRLSFGQALGLDASLELDPAYKNGQLQAVWEDVKKKGPPAGGGGGGGGGGGPPPAGDFTHSPPAEGLKATPLAIFAEYPGGESLARVIAKYRGSQMGDWKALELRKMGDTGWGGLVPCRDVTVGAMQYYIQGFNAQNDPVATSGSRNKPFSVPIKESIAGAPPTLPGQQPPKQCSLTQTAECPPDFPGCNAKKGLGEDCYKDAQCQSNSCVGGKCAERKSGGEECQSDDECSSGSCSGGQCTEAKKGEGENCDSDDACDSGTCQEGKCSGGGRRVPRLWIGLQVGLDLYLLPGAQDVCKLNTTTTSSGQAPGTQPYSSGNPYSCIDSGGNAFPGNNGVENSNVQTGHSDQVQGGFSHGPLTLSLSVDYALNANVLVGVRGGYEFLTIPSGGAFAPIHAEARFTYLIGHDAIHQTIAPMLFVAGGIAEFDASVPVNVFVCPSLSSPPGQCTSPQQGSMNAWLTAGPGFGAIGGGVRMSLAKNVAATGAIKAQGAFGGTAGFLFGVVPELGIQYGF